MRIRANRDRGKYVSVRAGDADAQLLGFATSDRGRVAYIAAVPNGNGELEDILVGRLRLLASIPTELVRPR